MIVRIVLLNSIILSTCFAQNIQLVDKNWIATICQSKNDTTYVINFWATWCKPCIEELPAFEKLNAIHSNKKVKVILVSCDFIKQLNTKVRPFINKQKIQSSVAFMYETDPNTWIEKVDPKFTGAIPATLILNGKKGFRYFKEGETTFDELDLIIKPLLN